MWYKTDQPRISVTAPFDAVNLITRRSREIGQRSASHEAMFWQSIGYTVSVSHWDGRMFRSSEV